LVRICPKLVTAPRCLRAHPASAADARPQVYFNLLEIARNQLILHEFMRMTFFDSSRRNRPAFLHTGTARQGRRPNPVLASVALSLAGAFAGYHLVYAALA
jgi:hypothetical protein